MMSIQGKLFPSRGECLGLYRCVLIIFFLSFFKYCTTPSRGLHAGGLRLKATVQKVYGKRKDKDDSVNKNVQEELKEG